MFISLRTFKAIFLKSCSFWKSSCNRNLKEGLKKALILVNVKSQKLWSESLVCEVEDAVVPRTQVDDDGVEALVDPAPVLTSWVADGAGQLGGPGGIVAHVGRWDLESEFHDLVNV